MFEAIVDFPYRAGPAAIMTLIGLALSVRGVRLSSGWAHHHDPVHNLRFVRGFRLLVIGLALLSIAAAWQWQILWLFVLALAIAFEEILESSIHAFAIKRGLRLDAERLAHRTAA